MKNSTRSKLPQLLLLNFLAKFVTQGKRSNEHFNLCEVEMSLGEFIKFINFEINNKSPGNDGLTAEFYKHFSNELAPVLLDVFDYWGKLCTMGVTSRTGITSSIYKKCDKNDIANDRLISLLKHRL